MVVDERNRAKSKGLRLLSRDSYVLHFVFLRSLAVLFKDWNEHVYLTLRAQIARALTLLVLRRNNKDYNNM